MTILWIKTNFLAFLKALNLLRPMEISPKEPETRTVSYVQGWSKHYTGKIGIILCSQES